MEEIIVYPSKTRLITVLVAVVVLIAFLVVLDRLSTNPVNPVLWLFIAAPCLVPITISIYHLIKNRPCMFINDESIVVNSKKPWEVRFADVDSFYPVGYRGFNLIGIRYKKESPYWKPDEEIEEGRKERMLTSEHPGASYEIPAGRLSIKMHQLLVILNERVGK